MAFRFKSLRAAAALSIPILLCFQGISYSGNSAKNEKGVNYDPAGVDSCNFGCLYDFGAIAQDMTVLGKMGARWGRFSTPALPLISPSYPDPSSGISNATATLQANQYLAMLLSGFKGIGLNPILAVTAWNYTPGPGPGCAWSTTGGSPSQGCYNVVSRNYEPVNEFAGYQAWLTNLVKTSGATTFEIGNEANLNAFGENGQMDPDSEPSGWAIPNCQLDDPTNTVEQCNLSTQNPNTEGRNPEGFCDGRVISWVNPKGETVQWKTPDGPPARYAEAVGNYVRFLKDSSEIVRAANPKAKVILGGLSSWHSACFIDEVAARGGFNFVDAVAFHAYPFIGSASALKMARSGARSMNYLKGKLDNLAAETKSAAKPIWVTEFGFAVNSVASNGPIFTEENKAAAIKEEWALLAAVTASPLMVYQGRDGLSSFDWSDPDQTPLTTIPGFGLYAWENGSPVYLPAFRVFQNLSPPAASAPEPDTADSAPEVPRTRSYKASFPSPRSAP